MTMPSEKDRENIKENSRHFIKKHHIFDKLLKQLDAEPDKERKRQLINLALDNGELQVF